MGANLRIGEILAERGYVNEQQMEEALAYQKGHRDRRVGQILIELQFVTEQQVLEALASRLDLEIVDVSLQTVDLEAVAMVNKELAEKNLFLPLSVSNGTMVMVTNDPLNYFALEEVRQQTGCYLKILLGEEKPLRQAISYYFAEVGARQAATDANAGFGADGFDDLDLADLDSTESEAPIIHLLNSLVQRAVKSNASDIHIEPFERETKVRMRIDGVLLEYVTLQRNVHQPLIARIKIMANLDIAEKRIPQDGHFRVRTENGPVNIRVSLMPTVFGEKAVMRLLIPTGHLDYGGQFGMEKESYERFLPLLNCSNGIIYITGPTGSGKSTVVSLLPRLMDVTSGKITIDGVDIRDINIKDLRNNIGFVPQKNILFSGDIVSNVGYGLENANQDDLQKAVDIAQASEFINTDEKGFEREISQGGTNVSGGQKQRLAIARAISKKAPIYVFDDSFSALDYQTDAKLRAGLAAQLSDTTCMIVAQRIGTIRHADRIIVLDEGKSVGVGTHEELMQTCDVYREIAMSQLSAEELGGKEVNL